MTPNQFIARCVKHFDTDEDREETSASEVLEYVVFSYIDGGYYNDIDPVKVICQQTKNGWASLATIRLTQDSPRGGFQEDEDASLWLAAYMMGVQVLDELGFA